MPEHGRENEMVDFEIVRNRRGCATVPVYCGFNRPVLSFAAPALAGLPVWLRVGLPWGKERLGYPFGAVLWEIGPGRVVVRGEGREVGILSTLPFAPLHHRGEYEPVEFGAEGLSGSGSPASRLSAVRAGKDRENGVPAIGLDGDGGGGFHGGTAAGVV